MMESIQSGFVEHEEPHKTVRERLLEHIQAHAPRYDPYKCPFALTQPGMAVAMGIARPHVNITVRKLVREGFIEPRLAHVRMPDGKTSRVRNRVYVLVPSDRREDLRALHALADYTHTAYGPHGCATLMKLLSNRIGTKT